MSDDTLFIPTGVGLHLLPIDESPLADVISGWIGTRPDCAIRRVRGRKSSGLQEFMNEAGAALQFPYYFGENWDAFVECIQELSGIRETRVLVVIEGADAALVSSERDFRLLLESLSEASEFWRGQTVDTQAGTRSFSFHTLLACSPGAMAVLEARVKTTGVPFSILEKPAA